MSSSCPKERSWIDAVREQNTEMNIWAFERGSSRSWRNCRNEGLHNLYTFRNFNMSRAMGLEIHVVRMTEMSL
jgi:hypothetical protein